MRPTGSKHYSCTRGPGTGSGHPAIHRNMLFLCRSGAKFGLVCLFRCDRLRTCSEAQQPRICNGTRSVPKPSDLQPGVPTWTNTAGSQTVGTKLCQQEHFIIVRIVILTALWLCPRGSLVRRPAARRLDGPGAASESPGWQLHV